MCQLQHQCFVKEKAFHYRMLSILAEEWSWNVVMTQ